MWRGSSIYVLKGSKCAVSPSCVYKTNTHTILTLQYRLRPSVCLSVLCPARVAGPLISVCPCYSSTTRVTPWDDKKGINSSPSDLALCMTLYWIKTWGHKTSADNNSKVASIMEIGELCSMMDVHWSKMIVNKQLPTGGERDIYTSAPRIIIRSQPKKH